MAVYVVRAFMLGLLLVACAAPARAQNTAEAFTPLIGCWRAAADEPGLTDELCFERLGAHVVALQRRGDGAIGETTFHDDDAGGIIFAHAGAAGTRANGVLRAEGDRFVLAPHTLIAADGRTSRLRGSWVLEASSTLTITMDEENEGRWRAGSPITYQRAP